MLAVFVIVILFATCAGATCGMGGGVIIKPVLDALSPMSAFQINFVSSMCVLAMALSSFVLILSHIFMDTQLLIIAFLRIRTLDKLFEATIALVNFRICN